MEIFISHTVNRIFLSDTRLTFSFIYSVSILLIAISSFKTHKKQHLLDFTQTQQLKGLAILLIVIAHTGTLATVRDWRIPFFASCGVSIFLFLSGYGLTQSYRQKHYTLLPFIKRRINRVFVPYWITTVLFLVLDYSLLSKTYTLKHIACTTAGLNVDATTQQIDYVRWFITLLVFYYVIFIIATKFTTVRIRIMILLLVPIAVCLLNYFFHVSEHLFGKGYNPWNNYLCLFPAGCLIGEYRERIEAFFSAENKGKWRVLFFGVVSFCTYITIKEVHIYTDLPAIIYASAINNLNRIAFTLFTIVAFSFLFSLHRYSRVLYFLGFLSYELYLLHAAFMVKYDFIFFRLPVKYAFFIFSPLLCLFAYVLRRLSMKIVSIENVFPFDKTATSK